MLQSNAAIKMIIEYSENVLTISFFSFRHMENNAMIFVSNSEISKYKLVNLLN